MEGIGALRAIIWLHGREGVQGEQGSSLFQVHSGRKFNFNREFRTIAKAVAEEGIFTLTPEAQDIF